MTIALTPTSVEERDKLSQAVKRLSDEDPTLVNQLNPETGELTLAGMGELHLDVTVDRLRTEFGLKPTISPPQVAYRETVRRAETVETRYKKQSGGRGHFAHVDLRVEPLEEGKEGIEFVNEAAAGLFPLGFRPADRNGRPRSGRKRRYSRLSGDRHQGHPAGRQFPRGGFGHNGL